MKKTIREQVADECRKHARDFYKRPPGEAGPEAYMDMMFGQPYDGVFTSKECRLGLDLAAAVVEAGDYPARGAFTRKVVA